MQHIYDKTPSYWCTWSTQNRVAEDKKGRENNFDSAAFLGDQGAQLARAEMNEDNIFRSGGWADFYPEIRGDLFFMLDDGWDVPYGVHPDKNRPSFGSLILDKQRFPSFEGDDKTRLKKLSDAVKARGWRGLGIWVSAQTCGDDGQKPFNIEENEPYWKERLEESKFAGVKYWKVDWGARDYCVEFREMLTRLAAEIYPELIVEHAVCQIPLNGFGAENKNLEGRFIGNETTVRFTDRILKVSPVFRSYDIIGTASEVTTIDRLSYILKRANGLVNAEDEPYIAASLGCSIGLMRSPAGKGKDLFCDRLDEAVAAVKWQRNAPAFAGGEINDSTEILSDTATFTDTWFAPVLGKEFTQYAPAAIARNTPLPQVYGYYKPFITCCAFEGNRYAVAAHERNADDAKRSECVVICDNVGAPEEIGVFGNFKRLEFLTSREIESATARSLFDEREEQAEIAEGNRIRLQDRTISAFASKKDCSRPAFVIEVKYKN